MIQVAPDLEASIKQEAAEQGVSENTIVTDMLSAYRRQVVPSDYVEVAALVQAGDNAGLVEFIGRDIPARAAAAASRELS